MNGAYSHPTCPVLLKKIKLVHMCPQVSMKKHLPPQMAEYPEAPHTMAAHADLTSPHTTGSAFCTHWKPVFGGGAGSLPGQLTVGCPRPWSCHLTQVSCVKSTIRHQVNGSSLEKLFAEEIPLHHRRWAGDDLRVRRKPRGQKWPLPERAVW